MNELKNTISQIVACSIQKIIISKPQEKSNPYKKIVIERKKEYFQAAKYTEKQVFHDNIEPETLKQYLLDTISNAYLQINAWDTEKEHILLLSKKGKITYKTKNHLTSGRTKRCRYRKEKHRPLIFHMKTTTAKRIIF